MDLPGVIAFDGDDTLWHNHGPLASRSTITFTVQSTL